jgi:hypothetical protein
MKQDETSTSAYFVTLTYNTDIVPITKKGYMTLDKTDIQKFIKRLRKYEHKNGNTNPLKYYACGEYGTNKQRPHYHLILFNASPKGIEATWTINGRPIGVIHLGTVTGASIGYTLKYMCKEPTNRIPAHANDDREKIFSCMSKGLGANYLTNNIKTWHKNDLLNRMYVPLVDGKKIAMPRYYKQKIYTEEERQKIGLSVKKELELLPQLTELQRVEIVQDLNKRNNNKRLNKSI